MDKKLSRAPLVNVEKCSKFAGGQFDLVLIGSQRVREMRKSHRNKEKTPPGVIDALLEIQEGKIDPVEYLARVGSYKNRKSDNSHSK